MTSYGPSSGRGVMLAAGGTGGHLFPAHALAEELSRRGHVVDLVTDERVSQYGIPFPGRSVYEVPSATLASRSPTALAYTTVQLARGLRQAHGLLGRIKPRVIVGFGGYPTFPPILAATLRGIPTVIHEQNAVMGRANRMLARRVTAIAASFDGTRNLPPGAEAKLRVTGNPVRNNVIEWARMPYRLPALGEPLFLLIFGGSQGARYFSDTLPPALALLPAELRARLRVVQQCRQEDLARVEAAYREGGIQAELATFFVNLPERISRAHLVIGRAGASTVAELAVLGRPSILVPLPHSLDNDQLQNATRLAEAGGAWCLEQKDLGAERLAHDLRTLFDHPERMAEAASCARGLGRPNAVALLADLAEALAIEADRT